MGFGVSDPFFRNPRGVRCRLAGLEPRVQRIYGRILVGLGLRILGGLLGIHCL